MTGPTGTTPLDAVPAAALFGAVAGALSVRFAYFDGLTAALAALLLLAWLIEPRRARRGRSGSLPPRLVALLAVGAGWVAFLAGPPALAPVRGLLLGLVGLPLWFGFVRPPAVVDGEAE